MKEKLLVLSQFFYPDKISTGKVISELFFTLDKSKFDIKVVSGRRQYQDKSNSILPSYEVINNVVIHRVLKMLMPKEKAWGRLFNYIAFFFMCSYKLAIIKIYKDVNIIFTVSNPPILPLLGALFKSDRNNFIYLIHDLYPDIAIKLGVVTSKNVLSRVMFKINYIVFKRADKIIVLGRDMKEYLMRNYNVPGEKISIITNWSEKLTLENFQFTSIRDKFKLVYTGNLGRFHDLEIAIEVAQILSEDMELIFVGEGAKKESLVKMVNDRNIKNVKFLSYLDDEEYKAMLTSADGLLLSLEEGLAGLAVPSKFYTYLAAGKPVVAITDQKSEVALVINEEKCGIVVKHGDVDYFVQEIKKMMKSKEYCEAMGVNAYCSFIRKYEKSVVIHQFQDLFCSLSK